MNKEQFEIIRKENTEKMSVTKDNLGEKSVDFLNMFARNFDFYVDEYKIYQDMLTKKERLYSEYYKKYRYDNKLEARTTGEIESFIHTEEIYYKICLDVNRQELVVKYFEGICDSLKKLSYNIKNIIDLKNLGMQI